MADAIFVKRARAGAPIVPLFFWGTPLGIQFPK